MENQKTKISLKAMIVAVLAAVLMIATMIICGCTQSNSSSSSSSSTSNNTQTEVTGMQHHDGYTLDQMTVLSRHNIRSPLTDSGSTLGKLTTHEWFNWTAKSSELSLRGDELETMMGQYFRRYLEKENFIPENWIPEGDQAYFYSNSYQRTIATAQYFSSGMLPIANVKVNHKFALNQMDTTFLPFMTYMNDNFQKQVMSEIEQLGNGEGLQGIQKSVSGEIKTIENILDFKDSPYAKEKNIQSLPLDDLKINMKEGDELTCSGTLKTANSAADALKLQYYEEPDDKKAAWGKNVSYKQWEEVGKVADVYEKVLFGTHTAAINAAHPMLLELQKDMNNAGRKFSFLCGHDSTILSVVTALGVKDYELPNAISKLTPIGVKLVINKWVDKSGEKYCTLDLVYATVDQLRHRDALDVSTPPMSYQLELDGLTKNKDGMYKLADVEKRFNERIAEYDKYK